MTPHEHGLTLEGKRAAVAVGPLYEEIEALYPLYRLREAGAEARSCAFICHGGWVPISAGIVEGRRITGNPSIEDDVRNAGAHCRDSEVVVDGHLVSSRKPDDLPAFMRATIEVAAHAGTPA